MRIIARLDIKGPNLVKGVHLEGLRVLGKPEDFARYYYEHGIDELYYNDVVASLYGRNSLSEIIQKTAANIFIPLTVGGGIRTVDDIKYALRSGADKVSINSAAVANPALISEAASCFGSSTIVVSIDVIKQKDNNHLVFTDGGREHTGLEVVEWAKKAEVLGAGEIILTSIDQEGTGEGFDVELIQKVTRELSIPIISAGGAGSPLHVLNAIHHGSDAVAIASMFHYEVIQQLDTEASKYDGEGNTEYLKKKNTFNKISPTGVYSLKQILKQGNVENIRICR